MLPPGEFIPVAEQTGLIVPLGEWVMQTACRQVARWQHDPARAGEPLWLAVNVSPRQLDDPRLPEAVIAALQGAGLEDGSLVLELTESALMPGDATRRDALTLLRRAGARLFLDDFGTGYSSLTHLTQLPIQAVKIDRSFVAGLPDNPRNAAVVSSLITLSAALHLDVIAEGVETRDELHALQGMHCEAVQGFLLDLPTATPQLAPRQLMIEQGTPAQRSPLQHPAHRPTC
jgi:EAL domain-containing protein (putative c-di-GMP-specific phosphodiesterase class I)